jgi:hypothetical protein
MLLPTLITISAPIIGYFVLHAAGMSDFWALAINGGVVGLITLLNTVRRRRFDSIGFLVLTEVAVSLGLLFLTRNPRILLLRPSFYAATTGVYFLSTLLFGRPFTYQTGKPFAAKGDAERLAAYERTWETSAKFRKLERMLTAAWGVGLLMEAALRAWIVFHYSVKRSVLLSHAPAIALIFVLVIITRRAIPVLRDIVKTKYQHSVGNPQLSS